MQCFFQFWGKARDGLLELYKPVNIVQCRSHNSHNTKYNTYSCLWSAVKRCSEIAEGWSYPYFLSTMNLEMCCVILSTGLCFCATGFIRPPWGLFDGTFWVFYCPLHFRTFTNWCRMKGRCFTMPFLLLVGENYISVITWPRFSWHFFILCLERSFPVSMQEKIRNVPDQALGAPEGSAFSSMNS